MAVRTTTAAVQTLLGVNYDDVRSPSLTPFLDSATVIVDRVATCATNKGLTLTTAELELIERWLSAYLYTKQDPMYSQRSTAGKSGGFVGNPETPEWYKDGALAVDYSGCLKAILNRQTVRMGWLGKPPSEQIAYEDRD